MSETPGLDLGELRGWLDSTHPGLRTGALTATVIAGGKSNLTYRVSDGTTTWALRRPPLGHALPTAHDMTREFTVISALCDTDVPVATPIVLCQDPEVLGAPFYLMSFIDGVVLDQPETLATLDHATARRSCEQLVDTLLALHALEPASIGLAEFGRPEGFLARQLKRWRTQWESSETETQPVLPELISRLTDTLPEQTPPGIVHGDYRLTNVMYTPDVSRIAAVVDWEMATIGDPLADVGLLVVYQSLTNSGGFTMPHADAAEGFLTPDQMVQRYAAGSTRDLSHLDWYIGFGYFKLAVIAQGIHYRFLQGHTVGTGFDTFGTWVPLLLNSALEALDHP
ncbi:MAG: phosphotransferase family protein [Actinobacteria bacterium]|nr:phosphotransferase family protein [Actinomycetota bacterium]